MIAPYRNRGANAVDRALKRRTGEILRWNLLFWPLGVVALEVWALAVWTLSVCAPSRIPA